MNFGGNFHHWCEADDIVTPENCFDFAQVLLGKICAGINGTIIDTTNFERQRIGLRGDEEISSQGAKFMGEAIADVERNAEGCGDDGHAKSQSRAGEQLAAGTASKGIGNEAKEHK
jgi:hypothetical protein